MKEATILFPHQLFENITTLRKDFPVYLVEEYLFFKQFNFHKQKLAFHRASMKFYEDYLLENGFKVIYIESNQQLSEISILLSQLINAKVDTVHFIDPTDNWLLKRITHFEAKIKIVIYENPLFINTKNELRFFFKESKKKFFHSSFYKQQRIKRNVLISEEQPVGGKWTYDVDNRKKYPKNKVPPKINFPKPNNYYKEALNHITSDFSENLGAIENQQLYPCTFSEARNWLTDFFKNRFHEFGDYEDAVVNGENFLNHSILSPLLNVGLLTPNYVIETAITFAKKNNIPINSLEGFIRQILGWREFIRGIYELKGSEERTRNFWNHTRKIPKAFYNGTTGILPVDSTIKKILKTGYAHHIERLMILGNFMLLCEFDPNEVYQWFMEFFVDSYDWVMVPNVYGMSLYADGGIMTTKPYISSSNYIKKMSNYPSGDWNEIWDGLFWRFMDKNRAFLSKNTRLRILIKNLDKMDVEIRNHHFSKASIFLNSLV